MKTNKLILFMIALALALLSCGGGRYAGSMAKNSDYQDQRYSGGMSDKGRADNRPGGITKKTERMIIFQASYTMDVDGVAESLKRINAIVDKYKGFIESSATSDSYRIANIVVRVPVASFYAAIGELEKIGEVRNKEINASDVTQEFTDMNLRVETSQKVRERLYSLLTRTKDVKERIKILAEIDRLTNIIENLTAKVKFYKSRAAYSTIVIRLHARIQQVITRFIPSPFPWISNLNPDNKSIYDDGGDIAFEKPEGFFDISKDYYKNKVRYIYISPDEKVGIRAGVVDNTPVADVQFWTEAFDIEIENRKYTLLSKTSVDSKYHKYTKYVVTTARDNYYIIAFTVVRDKIIIVEAVYTSEALYKKYAATIDTFITTVRWK